MKKNIVFLLIASCAVLSYSAVDFNSLGDNTWVQQATSGNGPSSGGDVHWAFDTAGFAYMFGGCTYGNGAAGTHNDDVYRFDVRTGNVARLSSCSNNTLDYKGGCQAPHSYDSKRNCIWTSSGFSSTCGSGRLGLLKFQCPNGPLTTVNAQGGGHYFCYDPINDLIYQPSSYDGGLNIYNPNTNTWSNVAYPADSRGLESFAAPCCVDIRRGLFIMTMWSNYEGTQFVNDVWVFNGATRSWEIRTPSPRPQFYSKELAYDPKNDKCVLFGAGSDNCTSEVWAYDYASNSWEQEPLNGRSYNDIDKQSSTWPPAKHYMTWAYCEKYNAFVSWGGGQWIDSASCTDYDDGSQPLWIYRLSNSASGIKISSAANSNKREIAIFPSHSFSRIRISFSSAVKHTAGTAEIDVLNVKGEVVYRSTNGATDFIDLNSASWPVGFYLMRLKQDNTSFQQQFIVSK